MSDYQHAILDALGITRLHYRDPSQTPFTAEPVLSDLQLAMPQLQFVSGDKVALDAGLATIPTPFSSADKAALWRLYQQHANAQ